MKLFIFISRYIVVIAFFFTGLSAYSQVSIDFGTTAIVNSDGVLLHKYGAFSKGGFFTSINVKSKKCYAEL